LEIENYIRGYRITVIMRPCQGREGGATLPTRSIKKLLVFNEEFFDFKNRFYALEAIFSFEE